MQGLPQDIWNFGKLDRILTVKKDQPVLAKTRTNFGQVDSKQRQRGGLGWTGLGANRTSRQKKPSLLCTLWTSRSRRRKVVSEARKTTYSNRRRKTTSGGPAVELRLTCFLSSMPKSFLFLEANKWTDPYLYLQTIAMQGMIGNF